MKCAFGGGIRQLKKRRALVASIAMMYYTACAKCPYGATVMLTSTYEAVRIGVGQCKKRNVHRGNGAVAQRFDYTPVKCGKRRMHIQRTR